MRRNPLYAHSTEEDDNLQKLPPICTGNDIDSRSPDQSGPDNAWYLTPLAKPNDQINTNQRETSIFSDHTLEEKSDTDYEYLCGNIYNESEYEILSVGNDIDKVEPEKDYEPSSQSGPNNAWYLTPLAVPDDQINTKQRETSILRDRTLEEKSEPDNEYLDRDIYNEPDYEVISDGEFDPAKILYLSPIHKPGVPVTSQPLSSDNLTHKLVKISGPPDKAPDGKLYFESVDANADDGPRIVYVLEPPGREEPPPVYTKTLKEPRPQLIDRNKHRFWDKRIEPDEREFSEEDIKKASPNKVKILKRVASVILISIALISEYIMFNEIDLNLSYTYIFGVNFTIITYGSLECDISDTTSNLRFAYPVFLILQWAYTFFRLINIVGETIADVRGNGFQILHGWDETALGLMMIDIPVTTILIAFIHQCRKEPTAKLSFYIVSCLLKNFGRKYTTRQNPNKEVKISFMCYSFVLIDKNGKFSFSFRKEQWQFKFGIYCLNLIVCRDEGCCSDTRGCFITEPLPWKCCSFYPLCCIKVNLCSGVGCEECHCCRVENGNGRNFCGCLFRLILSIIRIIFCIIVWCLKLLFNVLSHIFRRLASPDRFKPITSDNMDIEKAILILNIIQSVIFIIGYLIKFIQ